jgi:hypothetical protein
MPADLEVQAARIPDRDRLLAMLVARGLDARADDEVGIAISCAEGASDSTCDDVVANIEALVMELGEPFVPIKHEGVVYVRPPLA